MLYKQKHIIPSGEYLVSSDDSFILEAFLGSCVGVTLWDPETRVGGLHHLLLPEPLPHASAWQPENMPGAVCRCSLNKCVTRVRIKAGYRLSSAAVH
jgi:hypothetical protein